MANIELEEVIKSASLDSFWATRGKAIQAYANLEQSLVGLFSLLAGIARENAVIVLSRIASTDSRNKILEKLFKKKFQTNYNLFRNSLFVQLRPLDLKRNEIVHWNVATYVPLSGAYPTETGIAHSFQLKLVPPSFWIPDQDSEVPIIDHDGLRDFIARCVS